MNIVLIIPTGIGCEIGGHAGDANPVAKLFSPICDNLILHPNVVNASDINEMPANALYVEGSHLDRFLRGEIELEKVSYNKILLVVNKPVKNEIVNAANGAMVTLGGEIEIVELNVPLQMMGYIENGRATGDIVGWQELVEQVEDYDYDALAISSPITVERKTKITYLRNGGINPWGGVEARLSKLVATAINKPVAHSPSDDTSPDDAELYKFNEIVDPRLAAEMVSWTYLHCIFKGLHKAPRIGIGRGLSVADVDVLISPINCVGPPHYACMEAGIPIIAVRENKTCLNDTMPSEFIIAENYIEAAGLIVAMRAGVNPQTVRRPCPTCRGIRVKGVPCSDE